MSWNTIVVGVDPSPSGLRALATAHRLADADGRDARCVCVHAVRDVWSVAFHPEIDVEPYRSDVIEHARSQISDAIKAAVPEAVRWPLIIRAGKAARVLRDVAIETRADVVVIGAKHHTAPVRWTGGSTAHGAARALDVPLLVAADAPAGFHRMVGAVDVSAAAEAVIAASETLAAAHRSALRFVHVIEPTKVAGSLTEDAGQLEDIATQEMRMLDERIWPRITLAGADHVVRRGFPRSAIAAAVTEWGADLLVVGAHGRGWKDRLLLGSMTQDLLTDLPCSILVIPVHEHIEMQPPRADSAAPAAREGRERATGDGRIDKM